MDIWTFHFLANINMNTHISLDLAFNSFRYTPRDIEPWFSKKTHAWRNVEVLLEELVILSWGDSRIFKLLHFSSQNTMFSKNLLNFSFSNFQKLSFSKFLRGSVFRPPLFIIYTHSLGELIYSFSLNIIQILIPLKLISFLNSVHVYPASSLMSLLGEALNILTCPKLRSSHALPTILSISVNGIPFVQLLGSIITWSIITSCQLYFHYLSQIWSILTTSTAMRSLSISDHIPPGLLQ